MRNNTADLDIPVKAPEDVLSNPALLFLFYRIEQILGIKAGSENLKNLNEYMEETCGASFIENPAAYEYLLTSREKIYEISKFLTVNETYFFRESPHFELLADILRDYENLDGPLQICSAACSIGCEAYSIAMLLDYCKNSGMDIEYNIDAFDVNNEAVETAKQGRYTANAVRDEGKSLNYILDSRLIRENNEFIVADKIKRKVRFFPHNIMRGIEKKYDIIFFRNSLIYFSGKNRLIILNYLADSLRDNGLLFLGVSETSSVTHPLLASRFSSDVFYFQKISSALASQPSALKFKKNKNTEAPDFKIKQKKQARPAKNKKLSVFCADVADILKEEEGKQNAAFVLKMFNENCADSLFGSQLAAAVLYFFNAHEMENASRVLSYLEKYNAEACAKFLRGEYYYLLNNFPEAEKYYQEACCKDARFWPAFYRIAILSSDSNRVRYEYKIKKTLESIELSKDGGENNGSQYECYMGGFSSDYFFKILEKKLS